MNKLINSNVYPANVLSAVFGESAIGSAYYFDEDKLDSIIDEIIHTEFTTEDGMVFFSLYKERKSVNEVAYKLACDGETVNYIHSRILRQLRHPKLSKRLRAFTNAVIVFNADKTTTSEFMQVEMPSNMPMAIAENDEVKAFVISPSLYNAFNQKADLVAQFEQEAKQVASESFEMIKKALRLAIERGSISTMLLQRELNVGFTQAIKILAELEVRKYISSATFGVEHEIYITKTQYEQLFGSL